MSGVIAASVFAGCGSSPSESSSPAAADTSATEQTEQQTTVQPLADSVKKQLDEALSKEAFKGVTQIVRGDTVIYQYTDGSDDNGQPMTIDASLPIGSVSKQFCAAAVMLLCDRGKLSLDDKLDKYYSDYKSGNNITIKNLLNMSSGIPDYYGMFMDGSKLGADEAENIKKIKEVLFAEELGFELIIKTNIPEDDSCSQAAEELAEETGMEVEEIKEAIKLSGNKIEYFE